MATINPTVKHDQHTPVVAGVNTTIHSRGKGSLEILWETLTDTNEVGLGVISSHFGDKTIQLTGTFTTTTALIEGSNDSTNGVDGVWETLVDPQGNALSFTAAGIETILENPKWIRPRLSASGGSSDVDITLIASTVRQA